jgi:hypothetical protein
MTLRSRTANNQIPTAKGSGPPILSAALPSHWTAERKPTEDEIRVLAYHKWALAGKPQGDGAGFWLEAERELRQCARPTFG